MTSWTVLTTTVGSDGKYSEGLHVNSYLVACITSRLLVPPFLSDPKVQVKYSRMDGGD